jgi:thiamine pyrophosphate-dependent acetolactate synthase large subunit-like protein
VSAAVELLERSARPLVLAGGGVVAAGAHAQLHAFVTAAELPYVFAPRRIGSTAARLRPTWERARTGPALARACGVTVAESVEELLRQPGPALHHVPILEDAECLPMVAPGASTATMIS